MTKTTVHSKSGLDRILTANAVSSFIGTSFEAHRSDADARRQATRNVYARAAILSPIDQDEQKRLATAAFDWARNFTAAAREAEVTS